MSSVLSCWRHLHRGGSPLGPGEASQALGAGSELESLRLDESATCQLISDDRHLITGEVGSRRSRTEPPFFRQGLFCMKSRSRAAFLWEQACVLGCTGLPHHTVNLCGLIAALSSYLPVIPGRSLSGCVLSLATKQPCSLEGLCVKSCAGLFFPFFSAGFDSDQSRQPQMFTAASLGSDFCSWENMAVAC